MNSCNLDQLQRWIKQALQPIIPTREQLEVETALLLQTCLSLSPPELRKALLLHPNKLIPPEAGIRIRSMVRQRLSERIPIQYLLGEAWFYGFPFKVSPHVLIPRPETELLVETTLRLIEGAIAGDEQNSPPTIQIPPWRGKSPAVARQGAWMGFTNGVGGDTEKQWTILELGTGSGAISIVLLKTLQRQNARVRLVSTDISHEALAVARRNAGRLSATEIDFRQGDLFEPLQEGERFDILISNPPYIAESLKETLLPEVICHEPFEALFAGMDGYAFYDRIASEAKKYLRSPGGMILLEFGQGMTKGVTTRFQAGGFQQIEIIEDYAGIPRILFART